MPPALNQGDGASEFRLTDRDFRYISGLIGEHAGIVLTDVKKDLVYGRLVKRLRAHGMRNFSDYCKLIERDTGGEEFEFFVNSLTTNLTSFFRESHHFDHLRNEALPELMQKPRRKLRIWSAGCSTGAEAYSIAMVVADMVPADWDVKILATDIDTAVLNIAKAGIYEAEFANKGLDSQRLKRWAQRDPTPGSDRIRIRDELRSMISFLPLNLLEAWPMKSSFDIIFCRNVVIYFDKLTQVKLFDRIGNQLAPEGFLYIGHSESLNKVSDRFMLIGKTIYRRKG
ncbi:chemotaxis protein CheR [Halioglobus sp. HI00S01]|uniref:CheR family methyltransferase n=1 Tax=Halioglobus sp. HI00S01 TaxID=1822214 RepID=UPI0007C22531|nr:protein-glutamate O-methyltransferase CheR [Halioglobus sp. HI00S01]KZX54902.1 chemotaxis protein CheR [Halioglobus sp. HI00S01]